MASDSVVASFPAAFEVSAAVALRVFFLAGGELSLANSRLREWTGLSEVNNKDKGLQVVQGRLDSR